MQVSSAGFTEVLGAWRREAVGETALGARDTFYHALLSFEEKPPLLELDNTFMHVEGG